MRSARAARELKMALDDVRVASLDIRRRLNQIKDSL
jgi:hypothetical protein